MRKILFFITTLLLTLPLAAQQPASNRQQGRQYIAQQISQYVTLFSLNEQQAQQFDALYKAYNKKMRAVHDLYQKEQVAGATLTEEQVEQRILDNFAQSRAILDVREQYYKQFRQILTPSQINKIFEDEKARRAQVRKKTANG